MRILVSKFNMIGDVVLSTALLRNLKIHYPDSEITFATYDFCAPVLVDNPDISRVISYAEAGGPRWLGRNLSFFSWFIRNPHDLYLCLRDCNRSRFLGLLSRAKVRLGVDPHCGATLSRIAYTKWENAHDSHAVEHDLQILQCLGLPVVDRKLHLFWAKADEARVEALVGPGPFVQLHPTARHPYKEIRIEVVAELADRISSLGLRVVLTSSTEQKEAESVRSILRLTRSPVLNLGGRLTLPQLACLSSRAALYVGCDTAAMHMAAATGTRTVVWFGPTRRRRWRPWDSEDPAEGPSLGRDAYRSGRHVVVQKEMARGGIPCLGCDMRGCDHSGSSRCLLALEAGDIWPHVELALASFCKTPVKAG